MIPVFKPSIGDEECAAVAQVLKSGWIGLGPKTREFEEAFARYIGVRFAVGVNSATAALTLAMRAADVADKEVVTTPMTFVSTNHAILYNHAEPVFCDIEPDTLNIDAGKIEALVTPRTRAIVVVHYGGYAVDMDAVLAVARRHRLTVIEDAAHACGGEYRGRKLGSLGDIGCFSFHAVKNLAMGDGGMITTDDEAVYRRLLKLRWMGITKDTWSRVAADPRGYDWGYDVPELGFKAHMNDVSAAIGLVQLGKLDRMNQRRLDICRQYTEAFSSCPELGTPVTRGYVSRPACHNYVLRCACRDALHEHLRGAGIATSVHYIPNNRYEMYRGFRGATPVCDEAWKGILTLPLFPDLTAAEIRHIVDSVLGFLRPKTA